MSDKDKKTIDELLELEPWEDIVWTEEEKQALQALLKERNDFQTQAGARKKECFLLKAQLSRLDRIPEVILKEATITGVGNSDDKGKFLGMCVGIKLNKKIKSVVELSQAIKAFVLEGRE